MKAHEVKSWPEFFELVYNGTKTFELRKNDRGYAVMAMSDDLNRQEVDIVDILRFWNGRDDVPEELSHYLVIAADEIAGLRLANDYLQKVMRDAEPQF
jgi:Domain of unknown function (DUF3850)